MIETRAVKLGVHPLSLIFIASAGSLMLHASCTRGGTSPRVTTIPDLSPHSVETYWSQTEAIAKEWRADAYPRLVTVYVKLPQNPEWFASGITFIYESPSENIFKYRIACDEEECVTYEIEHEPGWLRHCKPFTLEDFSIDSDEALAIGLREGGAEYARRQEGEIRMDLAFGISVCQDPLQWRVLFEDRDLSSPRDDYFSIVFDANSGEELSRLPR